MELKPKEITRDIKLYELGIKDKLDGYDILMNLRGLKPFRTEDPNITHYGKNINDIKFTHYNLEQECILIKYELWLSIKNSFNLSYFQTTELTMWSIGSDTKLEGVYTTSAPTPHHLTIGVTPNC